MCAVERDVNRKLHSTARHQLTKSSTSSSSSSSSPSSLRLSSDGRQLAAVVGQVPVILDTSSAALLPIHTSHRQHDVIGQAPVDKVTRQQLFVVGVDACDTTTSRKSAGSLQSDDSGVGGDVSASFVFVAAQHFTNTARDKRHR